MESLLFSDCNGISRIVAFKYCDQVLQVFFLTAALLLEKAANLLIFAQSSGWCELGRFLRNSTRILLFTSRTSASLRLFTSDNRYNHILTVT